ncbi:MAG: hypothetical protein U1A24_14595 [Cypionkella sp.]|uniref:hypothetical protein n=1 Tax=Cypionkella sp. TaxID=2811411 RepID=UPI002ABBB590|nr:hypothetical protein [Cypionkella sp.]MDZ4311771.1 hypothetical protein [Cypionkella sp.]
MTARVVLHVPARMVAAMGGLRPPLLYGRIRDCLAARGVGVALVEGFDADAWREDGDLHIVENGRGQRPGVLNAATAYFEGFFHVDPVGIQAASRIGGLRYDPAAVDEAVAQAYLVALQQRFAVPRRSRYKQRRRSVICRRARLRCSCKDLRRSGSGRPIAVLKRCWRRFAQAPGVVRCWSSRIR